jgi:hypothetical protein
MLTNPARRLTFKQTLLKTMGKAYWICANRSVRDQEALAAYAKLSGPAGISRHSAYLGTLLIVTCALSQALNDSQSVIQFKVDLDHGLEKLRRRLRRSRPKAVVGPSNDGHSSVWRGREPHFETCCLKLRGTCTQPHDR